MLITNNYTVTYTLRFSPPPQAVTPPGKDEEEEEDDEEEEEEEDEEEETCRTQHVCSDISAENISDDCDRLHRRTFLQLSLLQTPHRAEDTDCISSQLH